MIDLTDDEIIKALECCNFNSYCLNGCKTCSCPIITKKLIRDEETCDQTLARNIIERIKSINLTRGFYE